jgi:hypothetical protein
MLENRRRPQHEHEFEQNCRISCRKCGELNYLTPHAFWNITDFGARCERCETINTITLENGELRKQNKTPSDWINKL